MQELHLLSRIRVFCCFCLVTLSGVTLKSMAVAARPDSAPVDIDLIELPNQWSDTCNVTYDRDPEVDASITCVLSPHDRKQWRLDDLRQVLLPLVDKTGQYEVAVDLQCRTGANVSLPYPMRAPGLVKLSVLNCRLLDKYADVFSAEARRLPDCLRVQDMRNCTWVVDPVDFERAKSELVNLTSRYECGQASTLTSFISWNMSIALTEQNDSVEDAPQSEDDEAHSASSGHSFTGQHAVNDSADEDSVLVASEDYLQTIVDLHNIQAVCVYSNLEVYDSSFNPGTTRSEFGLLVQNSKFPKLKLLNFSASGLTIVPPELAESRLKFAGSKLEVIDLSHNGIKTVGPLYLYPSRGLPLTLVLQFNNITTISMAMFEQWARIPDYFVDIRNNPVDCDCDLWSLLSQMRNDSKWTRPAMAYYRRHLSVMRCATPPELSGRKLVELGKDDLICPSFDSQPALVAVLVVVCIFTTVLAPSIRYRQEIRILMYTRAHSLAPCRHSQQTSQCRTPEKTHDAFVAYAEEDMDWVLGSLVPSLEEPCRRWGCPPCRLCVFPRDLMAGKPIIDNIVESIAASRHTIVVLSSSFVQCNWSMQKLHQAYYHSQEDGRHGLVLLKLDRLQDNDMAPVLRHCLKNFTTLRASDSVLWDRLLYSLHKMDKSSKKTAHSKQQNVITNGLDMEAIESISRGNNCSQKHEPEDCRVVFKEGNRTVSVDSGCSSVSETHVPVSPSQLEMNRALFV